MFFVLANSNLGALVSACASCLSDLREREDLIGPTSPAFFTGTPTHRNMWSRTYVRYSRNHAFVAGRRTASSLGDTPSRAAREFAPAVAHRRNGEVFHEHWRFNCELGMRACGWPRERRARRVSRCASASAIGPGLSCALSIRRTRILERPGVRPRRRALARVSKACSFLQATLATRAVRCGAHREAGFASGPAWVASQAGASLGEAKEALSMADAVGTMPITGAALKAGELSIGQAAELAKAEAAVPGAGETLVELAKTAERSVLRDAVRQVLTGSIDPANLAERQRKARCFRSWTNDFGMTCFAGALPPDAGQALVSRVESMVSNLKKNGPYKAGGGTDPEPFAALAADAFVALLGSGGHRPIRAEVIFVVSYEAYRRGHLHDGELCHLLGGCPVPLEQAAKAVEDAFIKAIVTDGKEILRVAHLGRHFSVELRTALTLGPPPEFRGAHCAYPGCGRRYGLEFDHVVPLSEDGPTSFENLQPLCKPHHWQKTERDRIAATRPWATTARAGTDKGPANKQPSGRRQSEAQAKCAPLG